ncbi:hypothetical protein N7499_000188 [Penicillium canescens]|uniref:Uncharacterized protein n=1 Tax=Penicillium canescens TaxID=5083 RepID=A0AAD6NBU7_PENCN|nr:hypothetical protein N7522_005766 [Penicillium canescens]KAJ6029046.1 hypothetical protein N7444_012033 [Penicillium canescens]KAJ6047478.1 hypothetical protein N7460_003625 [Penicillium canescens]KAJ6100558.1 hypothetical protein N7499_000188 [Penicillium canescens]KAJ6173020.1 hypothetical protein N7485_005832 [Penicillium canescens]
MLEKAPSVDAHPDRENGTITSLPENLELDRLGYKPELQRNRSVLTLLFQTLAIAAIPYGEGSPSSPPSMEAVHSQSL